MYSFGFIHLPPGNTVQYSLFFYDLQIDDFISSCLRETSSTALDYDSMVLKGFVLVGEKDELRCVRCDHKTFRKDHMKQHLAQHYEVTCNNLQSQQLFFAFLVGLYFVNLCYKFHTFVNLLCHFFRTLDTSASFVKPLAQHNRILKSTWESIQVQVINGGKKLYLGYQFLKS